MRHLILDQMLLMHLRKPKSDGSHLDPEVLEE
jgi:hypothetical protein